MSVQPQRRPPASPCVSVCVIDEERGLCLGCARTLDEIANWGSVPEATRQAVWAELPARSAALGLPVRRLDWQGEALLHEVERLFVETESTFVVGVYGAVGEVAREAGEAYSKDRDGMSVTLATPRSAIRIDAAPYLTAFEVARVDRAPLIALAVPEGRAPARGPNVLTDLGPDEDALLPRDVGGHRIDVGLGRSAARFTMRCDASLAQTIAPHLGTPWPNHLTQVGAPVLAASPVRVIEAPCVRAEVDAIIPPPGGKSPPGPHTHLLPDHIAQGFDTPPTIPLPGGYVLSALIYPPASSDGETGETCG